MTNNKARILWSDGTYLDVVSDVWQNQGKLFYKITDDWLWIVNRGLGDPWTTLKPAEPKFYTDLYVAIPGKIILHADAIGSTQVFPGVYHVIKANQAKQVHPDASKESWYGPSATYHMLDGGESLFIRFADPVDKYVDPPSLASLAQADAVANIDQARVTKWPWLSNIVNNIFAVDLAEINNLNTAPGRLSAAALMNPAQYARRTGIADTYRDYQTYHMFGTKEPGTNVRLEYYDSDVGFFLNYRKTGDLKALSAFKYLLESKIARGFYDVDDPTYAFRYLWSGEHYRGGVMVPGPSKEWCLDVCLGHLLWPTDEFITNAYDKLGWKIIHRGTVWSGPNGARILGRFMSNILDFYNTEKVLGNTTKAKEYSDRAKIEIDWAIQVTGPLDYFRESQADHVSGGEGTLALAYCFAWANIVAPYHLPKLTTMMNEHITIGGKWISVDQYMSSYFYYHSNPAAAVYTSKLEGLSWAQLPLPQNVRDGLEKCMYNAYPSVNFGIDYGSLYPSTVKWVGFGIESMRIAQGL